MKRTVILLGLLCCFSLTALTSSARAGLIVNGGFESTTVSGSVPDGWVVSGFNVRSPGAYTGNSVVPPASGSWALDLGPSGSDTDNGVTISQTFSVTTPGTYAFTFDYTKEASGLSTHLADFSWFLSGAVADSDSLFGVRSGYQTFSEAYSVTAPGNVTVGFTDIIGNGHSIDAVIDNVSFTLTSATAVPEPSSSVILAMGMIFVVFNRRKASLSRTTRCT